MNTCKYCDGFWMTTDKGLRRCTHCPKGADLLTADRARANPPAVKIEPVIAQEYADVCAAAMGAIAYYPSDPAVRGVIAREVRYLCHTPADTVWLADRMILLYRKWPGITELRLVYAARKVPHDGIMPMGISEAHPGGIPAETPQKPAVLALPPGRPVTAELGMNGAVVDLAKAMSKALKVAKSSRVLENPITAADVEREVEKVRMAKAIAEREAV